MSNRKSNRTSNKLSNKTWEDVYDEYWSTRDTTGLGLGSQQNGRAISGGFNQALNEGLVVNDSNRTNMINPIIEDYYRESTTTKLSKYIDDLYDYNMITAEEAEQVKFIIKNDDSLLKVELVKSMLEEMIFQNLSDKRNLNSKENA